MADGKCALCLQARVLKNSHIIPEFVYTALYDAKHRFHQLTVSDGSQKLEQKGLREKLLCEACEQKFSAHEKYVSEVFSGRTRITSVVDGRLVKVSGLDYHHFKLLGLSIVWRAGVSSLDFFAQVKLGPHAEKLRLLLCADNPGPSSCYPFVLAPLVEPDENDFPTDIIVQPTNARLDGHAPFRFVFARMIWVFVVSGHSPTRAIRMQAINEAGEMVMLPTTINQVPFITGAIKAYANAENG